MQLQELSCSLPTKIAEASGCFDGMMDPPRVIGPDIDTGVIEFIRKCPIAVDLGDASAAAGAFICHLIM